MNYNDLAGKKIQRSEALCDGVFAIAMTLLVLDVRIPVGEVITSDENLITAFGKIAPQLLSYFMSFITLGIYWTGHSVQYSFIDRSDRNLSWISIFYLMFIALLPFTTSFLSQHIQLKFSIFIYWLNILIPGLIILLHWDYAYKHNFLNPSIPDAEKHSINRAIIRRVIYAQSLYAIAVSLCFISTYVSIAAIILIQLNFATGILYGKSKS